jgi:hypothetical protein
VTGHTGSQFVLLRVERELTSLPPPRFLPWPGPLPEQKKKQTCPDLRPVCCSSPAAPATVWTTPTRPLNTLIYQNLSYH